MRDLVSMHCIPLTRRSGLAGCALHRRRQGGRKAGRTKKMKVACPIDTTPRITLILLGLLGHSPCATTRNRRALLVPVYLSSHIIIRQVFKARVCHRVRRTASLHVVWAGERICSLVENAGQCLWLQRLRCGWLVAGRFLHRHRLRHCGFLLAALSILALIALAARFRFEGSISASIQCRKYALLLEVAYTTART